MLRSRLILLTLFLSIGPPAWATAMTFYITVDTQLALGTLGSLDFQFNRGPDTIAPATGEVVNFNSDGTLDSSPGNVTGNVSNDLPADLTFNTSDAARSIASTLAALPSATASLSKSI